MARGTSDCAALYLSYMFAKYLGLPTYSMPPSIITLEESKFDFSRALVFIISQSGKSEDLVECHNMVQKMGAKTILISNNLNVISLESNNVRAEMLNNNLKRLNLKTNLLVKDANKFKPDNLADAVLLDAPCSSSGTLRKNPDILWRLTSIEGNYVSRMNSLLKIQSDLLHSASKMLKVRGILVYSVCSLDKDEGVNQIVDFMKKNSRFCLLYTSPSPRDS